MSGPSSRSQMCSRSFERRARFAIAAKRVQDFAAIAELQSRVPDARRLVLASSNRDRPFDVSQRLIKAPEPRQARSPGSLPRRRRPDDRARGPFLQRERLLQDFKRRVLLAFQSKTRIQGRSGARHEAGRDRPAAEERLRRRSPSDARLRNRPSLIPDDEHQIGGDFRANLVVPRRIRHPECLDQCASRPHRSRSTCSSIDAKQTPASPRRAG